MRQLLFLAAFPIMAGCAGPSVARENVISSVSLVQESGRLEGADLAQAISEASKYPLGSLENPIRVYMPQGQRNYLARLRCSDGKSPSFVRSGNLGPGVFGSIIDNYDVRCATGTPRESAIAMDMYHPEHRETAAPPGFTIVAGP